MKSRRLLIAIALVFVVLFTGCDYNNGCLDPGKCIPTPFTVNDGPQPATLEAIDQTAMPPATEILVPTETPTDVPTPSLSPVMATIKAVCDDARAKQIAPYEHTYTESFTTTRNGEVHISPGTLDSTWSGGLWCLEDGMGDAILDIVIIPWSYTGEYHTTGTHPVQMGPGATLDITWDCAASGTGPITVACSHSSSPFIDNGSLCPLGMDGSYNILFDPGFGVTHREGTEICKDHEVTQTDVLK